MTTGKVLFVGTDASGFGSDLWVTDGTSAGTSELTVAGAPTGGGGLFNGNPDFTVLGGKALFAGLDASRNFNLWVTDGTSGGTSELKVAGAFRELLGVPNPDLTVFGNKVLFEGVGTDGDNLWVTDGTAAGTRELHLFGTTSFEQIVAADFTAFGNKVLFEGAAEGSHNATGLWITDGTSAGTELLSASEELLSVSDLTVLGGKALFAGADRENPANLWVTDGTSAGTSELTIARTNPVTGTRPANITVIGGRALFTALDSTNGHETTALWVTNGTSAGTSELAIRGGGTSGLFFDVAPAFAVLGSKTLFAGDDVAGHIVLWVTDGTSAGTKELAVAGASTGGLVPRDITVFGDKALFVGDGPGFSGDGLWVTDGTAAGTSELTVAGTDPALFLGVPDFTVFGGKVLFEGNDSTFHLNLWVTDGTSAGTKEIVTSGAGSAGLFTTSLADFTVLVAPTPAPTGLALAAGSDSGVKGDDITNVTRPVITGKGVAGDRVTLDDGAKAIGTAIVAAAGTWSVTPTSALATGVHSLTATESGANGTSAASAALRLTIKISAPAPSGLSFAVAADKGVKGDTVTVGGKGEAGDRVTLYDGKTAIGGATVTAAGVWSLTTASPLAVGMHSLNASEVDVAANKSAAAPAQSLTVVRAAANAVIFVGTAGVDNFTGGAGNDVFEFSAANLANSDRVKGGGGTNELLMTTAGTVGAGGVGGVEIYQLGKGATDSLTLANLNFAGVTGGTITVYGGNAGNTVNAAALTGANRVIVWGGTGKDVLTGGAGNDIFKFTAAALTASDMVKGGGGNNEIDITTPGTVAAGGVSGVETWALANGGANSLTLANINFAGVAGDAITVYGGNAGNTISEAGVTAVDRVAVRGGSGADTLIAGQNAVMTGGAGKDVFWFTTPGTVKTPDTNTITDFAHASDRIAFSDAGFALGLKGASTAPKPLPAAMFTANSTGSFTTAAERFAYDTATGRLYYDARGNAVGSSRELVATLGSHATVTAADLFYVS